MNNIFRDKTVLVVGNGADASFQKADITVYCNKLGTANKRKSYNWQANAEAVFFIDSEIRFDFDFIRQINAESLVLPNKNNIYFYIYALMIKANFLQQLFYHLKLESELYCPACRNEHEDNMNIKGMHWALPLTNHLQGRPFTGFLAIYKALIDGAKKIYVTGFDLYRNKETGGWATQVGPHNIKRHADWLWNHSTEINKDFRVEMLTDTFKHVKECREFFTD